ncbi:MAG TPA: hypothetical protein VK736_08485 [Candidatus Binatia bacterium]|nr:hypothetical protein [Candidatus Binatia bacterium]
MIVPTWVFGARSAAASLAQVFTEEADAADVQEARAVLTGLDG